MCTVYRSYVSAMIMYRNLSFISQVYLNIGAVGVYSVTITASSFPWQSLLWQRWLNAIRFKNKIDGSDGFLMYLVWLNYYGRIPVNFSKQGHICSLVTTIDILKHMFNIAMNTLREQVSFGIDYRR